MPRTRNTPAAEAVENTNAETNGNGAASEYIDAYPEKTGLIRGLVEKAGKVITDLTVLAAEIATYHLDIREGILWGKSDNVPGSDPKPWLSKVTQKAVPNLPDWGGQSGAYRAWYRNVWEPMLDELIPEDERNKFEDRIRKQVQKQRVGFTTKNGKVPGRATVRQLEHLGLKTDNEPAPRNTGGDGGGSDRPTERTFEVDEVTAFVATMNDPSHKATEDEPTKTMETPLRIAAQAIASMSDALANRLEAEASSLPVAEAKATHAFIAQAMAHLGRGLATVTLETEAKTDKAEDAEKVAA